jgi:hypothetical protein
MEINPKNGTEVAEALSRLVNSFSPDTEGFVKTVCNDHRTLQQSTMRLFMACIKEWAENGRSDHRNEDTIDLCKQIVKSTKDNDYLPFI